MNYTARFRRTIANAVTRSGGPAARLVNSGAARAVAAAAIVLVGTLVAGAPALAAANTNVKTCDEGHLDAAVVGAPSGGTVSFNCDGTITLTHPIYVDKTLMLDGSGHAVALSGGNGVQLLQVASNGNLAVNHLTLTGGNGAFGGAIESQGGLTVSNSIFTNNSASYEGGAILALGTLTVSNVLFNGNTASMYGGAVSLESDPSGQATVTNAIFTNNSAGNSGGAIYNAGVVGMTINNSTIGVRGAGNSSGYFGGGIDDESSMSINGSTIKYNTAMYGGGINHYFGPTISLSGDTVEYNTATAPNGGGGINIIEVDTVVTSVNTTWAYNTPDNCDSWNYVSVPGCTG